jgi:NAD(P)-dependent dehydrogenase (short-subunit alcohol dehydrogenase family)
VPDKLFSVADQVVIVSGASRGIGRAIAQGFADRGAHIVITGRESNTLEAAAHEIGAPNAEVVPLVCDVADTASINRLVDEVLARYGFIDTLINVAGVNRRKAAEAVNEDEYDTVLDINLKGAFLLSQAVGRQMIRRGSGAQINIASLATERPLKHAGPYAMSKAGLGQMTRSLALEWGSRGVRVNAISPGFVVTDLTRKLWSDPAMAAWGQANIPQQRLANPDDMVGTALFLASPAAAYLTGQIIYVDGGFSAGWMWPIPE